MISLTAAAWFLVMPIWGVHDPVDWYEQEAETIYDEPGLEDIEMKLRQRELQERFRILENMGEQDGN
jgi:hypothetical protein